VQQKSNQHAAIFSGVAIKREGGEPQNLDAWAMAHDIAERSSESMWVCDASNSRERNETINTN
jgi:hypothetical protein